jgi:transcriptional regulator with XRE-family HTH domain
MLEVGKRIREVRDEYGMSQAELARRVGVAGNHLYQVEAGTRTPSLALLERIAKTLRVPMTELVREPTEEMSAPLDNERVRAWLGEKAYNFALMSDEDFRETVLATKESELPGLLYQIEEERTALELALSKTELKKRLFPVREELLKTYPPGEPERLKEAMRPHKKAARLRVLLGREYTIKKYTIENYQEHIRRLKEAESASISDEERAAVFDEELASVNS